MNEDTTSLELPEIDISSMSSQPSSSSKAGKSSIKKASPIRVTKEQIFKTAKLLPTITRASIVTPRRVLLIGALGVAAFLIYKGFRR